MHRFEWSYRISVRRYILFKTNNINPKLLENTTTLFVNLAFDDDILIK